MKLKWWNQLSKYNHQSLCNTIYLQSSWTAKIQTELSTGGRQIWAPFHGLKSDPRLWGVKWPAQGQTSLSKRPGPKTLIFSNWCLFLKHHIRGEYVYEGWGEDCRGSINKERAEETHSVNLVTGCTCAQRPWKTWLLSASQPQLLLCSVTPTHAHYHCYSELQAASHRSSITSALVPLQLPPPDTLPTYFFF